MSVSETTQEASLATIWQGEGTVNERDQLTCTLARFLSLGVQPGDIVRIERDDVKVSASVLQIDSEETLTLEDLSSYLPGRTVLPEEERCKVEILRPIEAPCPVCAQKGSPAESDHRHCLKCKAKMALPTVPAEKRKAHCDACVKDARERLVKERNFIERVTMFGGRRTIVLHARTVEESDGMQEWQDRMIIDNPRLSTQYMLDESAKAALAIALDDDGTGENPRKWLKNDTDDPHVRIPIMVKHFKGMNDVAYKSMLTALSRLDSLVEQACTYRIEDQFDDEQKMQLAEELATSVTEVTGTVAIFDGIETLTFAAPQTDLMDEANSFAENFLQGNKGKLLEGRGRFILGLARMAAIFRGDSKQRFDENSDFNDRLAYLLSLPLPLYYLYVTAGGVWQRRVLAASEVETLGNF